MDHEFNETSALLRRYRESCALSQQQVADALHINRSTYTKYETGKSEPGLGMLVRIAAIFHVSPDKLLPKPDTGELQDVAPERLNADSPIFQLAKDERGLIARYRAMTADEKRELYCHVEEMSKKDS